MSTIYIICIIFSIAYRYYQFKHHLDLYTYYYYKCRNNSTCISTCVYLFINSSIAAVRSFVYTRSFTCYRLLPRTIRIYMATKCACKIYLLQIYARWTASGAAAYHYYYLAKRFSSLLTAEATAYI